jgi:hypothetical protein
MMYSGLDSNVTSLNTLCSRVGTKPWLTDVCFIRQIVSDWDASGFYMLLLFFYLRRTIQSAYKVLFDGVTNNGCEEFLVGNE